MVLTKEEYTTPEVSLIIEQSTSAATIDKYTVSDITKIEKTKTLFGTNYVLHLQTPNGNTILTTLVTGDQKV